MAETLVKFDYTVTGPDGRDYEPRACGSELSRNTWQGWIEFIPRDGGEPVRTARETTQPNRTDTEYWATGLTKVYLEGALRRALASPFVRPVVTIPPPAFGGPAKAVTTAAEVRPDSVLNPFSVYEKGEALLRRQLSALSAWHLVNIALEYELTNEPIETLNRRSAAELIEIIIGAVRAETERAASPKRRQ